MDNNTLANYIFLQNKQDKYIQIQLDGVDTTTDLFMFCVELLCHGIYLTTCKQSVADVTQYEFEKVCGRLLLAGIKVSKHTTIAAGNDSILLHVPCNPNERLDDHEVLVQTADACHVIKFELQRVS